MANPILPVPYFLKEEAVFAYVEAHLWAEGPGCPHCGIGSAIGNGATRADCGSRSRIADARGAL
jgi:Transposase zinc-ribbon domain